ncbi:MAG TPA: DUF2865 domain-containing protein [Methylocella sp.]|nr:DUF2865 domain-containing protein [Methylocella sp.]
MNSLAALAGGAAALMALALLAAPAISQPADCVALAARIAALGDSGRGYTRHYGSGGQRLRAELDRAIRSARALGCDRQYSSFEAQPPQCPGLNAQIRQMQASIADAQASDASASAMAAKQPLIAAYNAYCRGQARDRGFFESLFGVLTPGGNPVPMGPQPAPDGDESEPGKSKRARGGSQALCVRSCDGGYFPLSLSARQAEPDELTNLCQALCPNAEVSVYTRVPYQDISTAVSIDGEIPYAEMPNALKFQKTFDPACTCKPPGQSWAEALAPAEQLLGRLHKTDIVVTPENSADLAMPKPGKTAPRGAEQPDTSASKNIAGDSPAGPEQEAGTREVTGPDGVKRRVRIIVPPL